jgi:hypothetical protein
VQRPNDETGIVASVTVLMDRDRVVLRPVGHLDDELIATVLGLVRCARNVGLTAVVDLEALEPDGCAHRDALARHLRGLDRDGGPY